MGRKHEAEELLRKGLHPGQVAKEMGISFATCIQYLHTRVGEGALRLSDIYFSYSPSSRQLLQAALESRNENAEGRINSEALLGSGLSLDDALLFEDVRSGGAFAGDMYEHVSAIELALHDVVSKTLRDEFGEDESGWWRQGVPSSTRAECAARRETDDVDAGSPFAYTTLLDLARIIEKRWSLFCQQLPMIYRSNRGVLVRDLARLNRIRNAVMHPVKRMKWSEEDFQFVKRFRQSLSCE